MVHSATISLSLATFNTHGVPLPSARDIERFRLLCHELDTLSLDVITLQEVWSSRLLRLLQHELPHYPYQAYRRGWLGPQAGLVILSRLPLQAASFVPFPPVAEPKKKRFVNRLKRALKRKGALVCTLRDHPMALCNVHLVANGDADWSEHSRYYAAHQYDLGQLVHLLSTLTTQTVLIAGDFNIPKDSNLSRQFLQHTAVIDLLEMDITPTFHPEALAPGQQAHCIDYLLLRCATDVCIQRTARLFEQKRLFSSSDEFFLSNHVGLMAQVELSL